MAGSVARKRELCPISIAAPEAALLVYHVFIVGAWLPGRTRDVNLHFLASYAARSRDRYNRTQWILGAINGIERSEDRSSRVCLFYFTILEEKDECATSLEAPPYRCFYAFRLSPILLLIPRRVSVIKILRSNYLYLSSRILNTPPYVS